MGLKVIVIGMGEIGRAVYKVFNKYYPGIDTKDVEGETPYKVDVMHVCYPYSTTFHTKTLEYMNDYDPELVMIHTTCPVGTTNKLRTSLWNGTIRSHIVHVPILGTHRHMAECIANYKLFIGFDDCKDWVTVKNYLNRTGLRFGFFASTTTTELLKLLSLVQYGMNIEFARYAQTCCDLMGVKYNDLKTYLRTLNKTVKEMEGTDHMQMVLDPPKGAIGGHCVLPAMEIMNEQFVGKHLREILALNKDLKSQVIPAGL